MKLTKLAKSLMASIGYHSGVFELIRYFQRNKVIILMYHRFSNKAEPFKIKRDVFENQIKFLRKKYNFLSLKNYSEILYRQRDDRPNHALILTIDDGYWDNYVYAYPILKKYSIPATIFLATDFITKKAWLWSNKLEYILKYTHLKTFDFPMDGRVVRFQVDNFKNWHKSQLEIFDHCRRLPEKQKNEFLDQLAKHLKVDVPVETFGDFRPLTWEQIIEMSDNGVLFGSHSCSHPILSRLTYKEMKHEIVDSKREIEDKLGVEVTSFCYPNGQPEDIDDSVIDMTRYAGYSCAVTTINGVNNAKNAERFLLRRLSLSTNNKIMLSKKLNHLI